MVTFITKKKLGKSTENSFINVLGSDGGTYLIEDCCSHKISNVSKKEFDRSTIRMN